jgi:uracil-DNA glycosylase family 4
VIGSAPGKREDERGLPFVGETGTEFWKTYVPMLPVPPDQIYVTNAVRCKPAGKDIDPEQAAACSEHWLPYELSRVSPEVILTMGSEAAALFGIRDLEMNHGFPRWMQLTNQIGRPYWSGVVIPLYHVAAGLHSSDFMIEIINGFELVARFFRGENTIPFNAHPKPDYALLSGASETARYLEQYRDRDRAHIDTETLPDNPPAPYCLSFSCSPGTGRLILASDRDALSEFGQFMSTRQARLHNGLYDLPFIHQMGIRFPFWRDTMIRAYHQADMPKALKVLGWRYCGVRMTEFMDLVAPFHRAAIIDWLIRASSASDPEVAKRAARIIKDGTRPYLEDVYLKSGLATATKTKAAHTRAIGKFYDSLTPEALAKLAACNPAKDYLKAWNDSAPFILEAAAADPGIGTAPVPRIDSVPIELVVDYACADADVTGRLDPILEAMMSPEAVLRRAGAA